MGADDKPKLLQIGKFNHIVGNDQVANVHRVKGTEKQANFHDQLGLS